MKDPEFIAPDRENVICMLDPRLSDEELVDRVRSGNQEIFSVICRKYRPRLLQVALRITKNAYDAEDVVQEAFLKAYLKINSFRSGSSISTWLTSIVINCSLTELRRRRRRPTLSLDELDRDGVALIDVLPDQTTDIENEVAYDEYSRLLRKGIAQLQPRLRMIFETHSYAELTVPEIAGRFELTVAATKARLFRARKELRRRFVQAASPIPYDP